MAIAHKWYTRHKLMSQSNSRKLLIGSAGAATGGVPGSLIR